MIGQQRSNILPQNLLKLFRYERVINSITTWLDFDLFDSLASSIFLKLRFFLNTLKT